MKTFCYFISKRDLKHPNPEIKKIVNQYKIEGYATTAAC
jgi:hypothetical protein